MSRKHHRHITTACEKGKRYQLPYKDQEDEADKRHMVVRR